MAFFLSCTAPTDAFTFTPEREEWDQALAEREAPLDIDAAVVKDPQQNRVEADHDQGGTSASTGE